METGDSLGNDYSVIKRLGSGGQAAVYLVKEIKSGKECVAKLIEKKKHLDNEIRLNQAIYNKINPPNPYIIGYITHGTANFNRNDKYFENVPYLILENAVKGDLFKYIDITGGFGEKCGKLFFQKILLGFQACHNIGVYHLDIKPENILLDDKYNPKICDFGLGSDDPGILKGYKGTENYMPPQILEHNEYTGIKADIFYLGSLLFIIVVGCKCFKFARKKDDYYKYLINKKDKKYLEILGNQINILNTLSKEFKELFTRMIAYEESDRPKNIQEILDDIWFDEIKEKRSELETELKNLFEEKEDKVDNFIKSNKAYLQKGVHSFGVNRKI